MADQVFQHDFERIARGKIGLHAELHFPVSPYHGQTGVIVDTLTMDDGQIVFIVEWSDGERMPYEPGQLRIDGYTSLALFDAAQARIESNPKLLPYRDTILYQRTEGDEHWEWVINAEVDEIIKWATSVADDTGHNP